MASLARSRTFRSVDGSEAGMRAMGIPSTVGILDMTEDSWMEVLSGQRKMKHMDGSRKMHRKWQGGPQ